MNYPINPGWDRPPFDERCREGHPILAGELVYRDADCVTWCAEHAPRPEAVSGEESKG